MAWSDEDLLAIIRGDALSWWPETAQVLVKDLAGELLDAGLAERRKNQQIAALEQRIHRRKADIANLEECRRYEAETEQHLVQALRDIFNEHYDHPKFRAASALADWHYRRGPRDPRGNRVSSDNGGTPPERDR